MAMIIKTHAEIVFKSLGLPFSQTEIFLAANPYIIKLKKSKNTQVKVKIKNCEIILFSKFMNCMKTVPNVTKAFGLKPATKNPSLYIAKLLFEIVLVFPNPLTFNVKVSYARYIM